MSPVRLLKCWYVLVMLTMLVLCAWGGMHENVFTAFARLAKDPWGLATLADCGFAFAAIGMWIGHRERSVAKGLAWTAAIMALGNLVIAAYVLGALLRLRPGEGMAELVRGRGAVS
jgi:hypothetical protein